MKWCVITGASGGIGTAIVEALESESYRIIGVGRKRPETFDSVFIECDLSRESSLRRLCLEIRAVTCEVWGLVNAAGHGATGDAGSVTSGEFLRTLKINTIAPAILVRELSGMMLNGGRIVSISSIVAAGKAGRSVYSASKAALEALSSCWALEFAARGITSNVIAPGPVDTPLLRRNVPYNSDQESLLLSRIPSGRMSRSDEIAGLVCYLMSNGASNLSGQVIAVDGAMSVAASASWGLRSSQRLASIAQHSCARRPVYA